MTVTRVLLIEGFINLLVALLKLTVGIATQSAAILADALHSFTDLFNNIVALAAMQVAPKPADSDHPYGHQKFEYLAVFFLAVLLAVLGIEIMSRALFTQDNRVLPSQWGLGVLLAALVVNIILSQWQRYWAKRLNSPLLRADAMHTFSDVAISFSVLLGWQLSTLGWVWADSAVAVLVALLVMRMAWQLFRSALPTLVDECPNISAFSADALMLIAQQAQYHHIHAITDVRSRWHGDKVNLDFTLRVTKNLSLQQAHELSYEFEQQLKQHPLLNDVIIHLAPHS